jgi:hypothetical protein
MHREAEHLSLLVEDSRTVHGFLLAHWGNA